MNYSTASPPPERSPSILLNLLVSKFDHTILVVSSFLPQKGEYSTTLYTQGHT